MHGAFVLGLPGETRETIKETIAYAIDLDLSSIQVSLASPYPGTEFYQMAKENGWIASDSFLDATGHQKCVINYPDLTNQEIFDAVELFYNKFYFRPRYIARSIYSMLVDAKVRRKLLKEGAQYLSYMKRRKKAAC